MTWDGDQFNQDLTAAVDSFDRDEAAALCDRLIRHLRQGDDPYPGEQAAIVLRILRGKRCFALMQSVADAFLQNDQTDANIRRQYAQSQLDTGNSVAAVSILESLEKDTHPDSDRADPEEYAEARGLLGRAYKDLYVRADSPGCRRSRRFMEKAIDYYRSVYETDNGKVWQGINTVALIRRAGADGVDLRTMAAPEQTADSMAAGILSKITQKHLARRADMWDFATALEACIGLDRQDEAIEWLRRYLDSDYTNAFELGSTYRQLTQVWRLGSKHPPGDRILLALEGALLKQQGSHIEIGMEDTLPERLDDLVKDAGYEKILGSDGFKTLKWFRTCLIRANAVAMVESAVGDAVGTAFVVRGGDLKPELGDELLLLTNAHVISPDPMVSRALRPEQAAVKFELWKTGPSPDFKVAALWSSSPEQLDATLLRPTPAIGQIEPMPLTHTLPLANGAQRTYIIGHPQGRKLSFSIHDNFLLDYNDRFLHYRSPTEPGSSGSPVLNADWQLIGLHHRGLQRMPRLNGKDGTYPANEGIWIQAIVEGLRKENVSTGS